MLCAGDWEPPVIPNPEYKGEWKQKEIENPDYKGIWVAPDIDNPDFVADATLYNFKDLKFVGFELWQVRLEAQHSATQCSPGLFALHEGRRALQE